MRQATSPAGECPGISVGVGDGVLEGAGQPLGVLHEKLVEELASDALWFGRVSTDGDGGFAAQGSVSVAKQDNISACGAQLVDPNVEAIPKGLEDLGVGARMRCMEHDEGGDNERPLDRDDQHPTLGQ